MCKQKLVWTERAHWIDQQSMPTLNRGRETPDQLIEHMDKDRDGSISCDEFLGSKGDLLKSSFIVRNKNLDNNTIHLLMRLYQCSLKGSIEGSFCRNILRLGIAMRLITLLE
mmetsp:Transcript_12567/g.14738  ORF Transcript_12567/g.14738 Transcript_12567/m.14738 type:complete len:112 (-) Transcript_12567:265-600(-)